MSDLAYHKKGALALASLPFLNKKHLVANLFRVGVAGFMASPDFHVPKQTESPINFATKTSISWQNDSALLLTV